MYCECDCGRETAFKRDGSRNRFVHGHHAKGRKKSEDEKKRIGEKNSERMKKYYEDNPEQREERASKARSGITEESRIIQSEKLTEHNRSEHKREIISRSTVRRWADGEMVEARQKAAETFKERRASGEYAAAGGHGSEQWRDRVSQGITKKYLDGGFEWSRGKYLSSKTGKECHYRSSWELRHLQDLDADPAVVTYQYEPRYLEYELDGRTRRYLPDFIVTYVDGHKELHEIGPKTLKSTHPKNVAKRKAAEEWCKDLGYTYRLISFQ